jgi:hypothetical protein
MTLSRHGSHSVSHHACCYKTEGRDGNLSVQLRVTAESNLALQINEILIATLHLLLPTRNKFRGF